MVNSGQESAQATASHVSDEELLLEYRERNDFDAFTRLVHRYERELYNYLLRYIGNRDMAEDVFQATFMRLHEKRHLYTEGRRVRPWLYSIATHLAVDALRREGRQRAVSLDTQRGESADEGTTLLDLLEYDSPSPSEQFDEGERRIWTQQAVDALPEHLRLVVILIYFQGLKYRDVSEILNIPLGTVKSRLHTALARLHEAWKEEHPRSEE